MSSDLQCPFITNILSEIGKLHSIQHYTEDVELDGVLVIAVVLLLSILA